MARLVEEAGRRALTFMVFLLIPLAFAGAQEVMELPVAESVVLPSRFFVGDLVEIRATVRVPSGVRVESPESLPTPGWGDLLGVSVEGEGVERVVRIRIRPFQQGTLTLPPLVLGEVSVSGLSVYVDSVTQGRDASLQDPRSQAVLPGTQLIVTVGATVVLLLPTVVVLGWRGGRRRVAKILSAYRENRPYRRARRRIRTLRQEMAALDGRSFYIEATSLLREYLANRIDRNLLSATTRELPERFEEAGVVGDVGRELLTLYGYADKVKFARLKTTLDRRSEDLDRIDEAVERLHRSRESRSVGV